MHAPDACWLSMRFDHYHYYFVAIVMKCALAQLDVFVCCGILFDLAGRDLPYIGFWQLGRYGLAGSASGPVQQQAD